MAQTDVKYEIKIMNVPFNNSYKDVVYFSSKSSRDTAFSNKALHEYEDLNVIVKNKSFILKGKWDSFNECNYMMYRYTTTYSSGRHTSDWFYSFITDVSYDSRLGTIINHTIDVWQTYHIDANFNECFIERGHIKKSDDKIGKWIAPEPIGFGADYETEKSIFSSGGTELDYTPLVCIESLSRPWYRGVSIDGGSLVGNLGTITTAEYEYGGVGDGLNNITGYYRIIPKDINYLRDILYLWQVKEYDDVIDALVRANNGTVPFTPDNYTILMTQANNHISDITSFSVIPKFIFDDITVGIIQIRHNGSTENGAYVISTSASKSTPTESVAINNSQLGCVNDDNEHYVPNNNKMYTSLARAFKIFNYNGVSIPMRPELITGVSDDNPKIHIKLHMHTYGNEIKVELVNYEDLDLNYLAIPYDYTFNYGINNNVGVAKTTRINAYNTARSVANLKYIQKGVGILSEIGMGSFGTIGTASGIINLGNRGLMHSGAMLSNAVSDTVGLMADIKQTEFDLSVERANAYMSQTVNIGNMFGDRLEMDSDFIKLRFAECNPTYKECEIIDKFLDVYGYSIQKIGKVEDYLTNRNHWNYIKTKDCKVKLKAPNNDTVTFNAILNSGTTVWRNLSYVGDYSTSNS